jgi:hypothetical protein
MKLSDKVAAFFNDAAQSAVSTVKVALQARRPSVSRIAEGESDSVIILGNGPSLADTIRDNVGKLRRYNTIAVNYAANAPEFAELQPHRYILMDPHFFVNFTDPNVNKLWSNLAHVDYEMTLYVPVRSVKTAVKLLGSHTSVKVEGFNAIGAEGWKWLRRIYYDRGLGMPRPRNVLIPAIMVAMQAGFRHIYIAGADHSWLRTISVNDRNEVVSIQPHFYKEDDKEQSRVLSVYRNVRLHEVLQSFYVAFRSYHEIADYARRIGVEIINITPGSFIDAFPRSTDF